MKKAISVLAVASLAILSTTAAFAENKVVEDTKKVGGAVGAGAKKVGDATMCGVKKVGSGLKKGAEGVGHGAKKVATGTVNGVKKTGEEIKEHMPGHKKDDAGK